MTYGGIMTIALLHALACGAVVWACLCRLNTRAAREHRTTRARYTLLLAAAASSGLQPLLWHTWPSASDMALAIAVLAWLVLHLYAPPAHPLRREGDA